MLNIISLSVYRWKTTWPVKVVKNLIKGLDILWYPYVLNQSLDSTDMVWIHDNTRALLRLQDIDEKIKIIIGPNLYTLWNLPKNLQIDQLPYIMPCQWIVDFWKQYGYRWILDVWPVWIDTDEFYPLDGEKKEVLLYTKKRCPEEVESVLEILRTKNIIYTHIDYGSYKESDFKTALSRAKYVIWVWCPETQWIALGEVLSTNTAILLWDIQSLWHWFPSNKNDASIFTKEQESFSPVTSAPYFDETCGKRMLHGNDVSMNIDFMEQNYQIFSPRKYILEHLSLAVQARAFLNLYTKYYDITFEVWINETVRMKKISSILYGYFWKIVFLVYDSSFLGKIRRFLTRKS